MSKREYVQLIRRENKKKKYEWAGLRRRAVLGVTTSICIILLRTNAFEAYNDEIQHTDCWDLYKPAERKRCQRHVELLQMHAGSRDLAKNDPLFLSLSPCSNVRPSSIALTLSSDGQAAADDLVYSTYINSSENALSFLQKLPCWPSTGRPCCW